MNRGEVWTVAAAGTYAGKPGPAVIQPNQRNGLRTVCRLMADKVTTVPRTKLGTRLGRLDEADMVRLNGAMSVFLGLAPPVEPPV
ncbi:type II toxin-antitoxin system PemK/MazF family toxin [Methylobacterium sp. A54F]